MARDKIEVNDRQLACARIHSEDGQNYLAGMAAAANFAWVNRSSMTYLCRQTFAKAFGESAEDLDMHVVYDVSHNIAKEEEHLVKIENENFKGKSNDPRGVKFERKRLLVHRKGATRAFGAHSPLIPWEYQMIGQPVLIGGTMGSHSYVLTGTDIAMQETFGSTCHGAGRARSRNNARNNLSYQEVLDSLTRSGISIRVASPKLVVEEAPDAYKDVDQVVNTCKNIFFFFFPLKKIFED